MSLRLHTVRDLEEALALAPELDLWAAEFMAQFADEPYPRGACERFLRARFADEETVLVTAAPAPAGGLAGAVLTGPFEDPLLAERIPMVLVLHVVQAMRHRGLGGALVEEASRTLASRGLARLAARVGHNDDALISMGERRGFVRAWELLIRE